MVSIYCNGEILTEKSSYINPWRGLMFSKKLKNGESVILDVNGSPTTVITMAFVFQKLDIICIDSNFQVVDVRKNVKPLGQLLFPKKKSSYYVESAPGSFNVKIGDKLVFK